MSHSPFFHGNPVFPADFLNRSQPVRRIVGRLLGGGQSSAIVGEPRTGKTSLLTYLSALETQTALYGVAAERMIFSFVDMQTLGSAFTPADFWNKRWLH